MKHYTLKELEEMPTISTGQTDDLKVDTGKVRVWLSRCTIADGEPYNNKVTIEVWFNNKWRITDTYEAL